MPTRITVIAVAPLVYRGLSVAAGESFEAKPAEALALHYKKKVRLVPLLQTRDLRAEPAAPAPRVKRQYRRRDMGPEA